MEPIIWEPWRDEAACLYADTDVFFPNGSNPDYTAAKRYCDRCPVRTQCAETALKSKQQYGMYGGLTPDQRARLRKKAA